MRHLPRFLPEPPKVGAVVRDRAHGHLWIIKEERGPKSLCIRCQPDGRTPTPMAKPREILAFNLRPANLSTGKA